MINRIATQKGVRAQKVCHGSRAHASRVTRHGPLRYRIEVQNRQENYYFTYLHTSQAVEINPVSSNLPIEPGIAL